MQIHILASEREATGRHLSRPAVLRLLPWRSASDERLAANACAAFMVRECGCEQRSSAVVDHTGGHAGVSAEPVVTMSAATATPLASMMSRRVPCRDHLSLGVDSTGSNNRTIVLFSDND